MNLHRVLYKGHRRRLRVRRGAAIVVAVGVAMLGGIAVTATSASAGGGDHQAWVCKYKGEPYVNETLKDGKQPILVDFHSTVPQVDDPALFKDGQSQSFVLALATDANTDQGEKYNGADGQCPAPRVVTEVTPEAHSVLGTCTAAGEVILGDNPGYSWSENTGTENDPIYTATANNHYILTGESVFTFHGISQLDPESAQCTTTTLLSAQAALTFTPGTCLAVGSVVATETAAYSWVVTGPATARVYTAMAKAGYTLTGRTSWTFNLSKIASQSVNPRGACYLAPPAVAGVVQNAPAVAGVVQNAPAVGRLAFTGAETVPLGLSGLLALVLGTVLMVAGRRQGDRRARE